MLMSTLAHYCRTYNTLMFCFQDVQDQDGCGHNGSGQGDADARPAVDV